MPEEQLLQLIKADAAQGIELAIEQYGGRSQKYLQVDTCRISDTGCGGSDIGCVRRIVEVQRQGIDQKWKRFENIFVWDCPQDGAR